MSKLLLYSVFHLNILFSSISEDLRPTLIERCYWPLLRLAREMPGVIAIEAPGHTLETINKIDPEWIKELRALISEGVVEFVGSGYTQVIGPLVPATVTEHNLSIGKDVYRELLDVEPRIAYLNEQSYSSGMIPLYRAAGYKALIAAWDSLPLYHPTWNKELKYHVVEAEGGGTTLPVLFTHSIAFQQFQRYAHGDISFTTYRRYMDSHLAEGDQRIFPLYTNDAEIFDFRPGRYTNEPHLESSSEWKRLHTLYLTLKGDGSVLLATPSVALDSARARGKLQKISLETAEQPIIVKKQDTYNLSRWSVTGRDSISINTICFQICDLLQKVDVRSARPLWKELCYAWDSDFRTHITESRYRAYRKFLKGLLIRVQKMVKKDVSKKRRAKGRAGALRHWREGNIIYIESENVKVALNTSRGLAIDSLVYPKISEVPLICTLPHGYFEDITLGTDFFSGSTIIEVPGHTHITDLHSVSALSIKKDAEGNIVVSGKIQTPAGSIKKTVTLEAVSGRLRCDYVFDIGVRKPASFRTGAITLNPRAFDLRRIYYQCHNGGHAAERFSLAHADRVDILPASLSVSASKVLGNTTGELVMGDSKKSVHILTSMKDLAASPMLKFVRVNDTFLCRVLYSLAEFDDSTVLSRGELLPRFRFHLEVWAR